MEVCSTINIRLEVHKKKKGVNINIVYKLKVVYIYLLWVCNYDKRMLIYLTDKQYWIMGRARPATKAVILVLHV